MGAVSELMVPELTRAQVAGDGGIPGTVHGVLRRSFAYALFVGAFLFLFADKLGMVIYHSAEAGRYIRLLAPLVPVMYTDTAVDGCLKGLGQHVWCMEGVSEAASKVTVSVSTSAPSGSRV